MLLIVARSAAESAATPSPKNSTNWPTTCALRSMCTACSTTSVAVHMAGGAPVTRTPTTRGSSICSGSPSMAASASMPPTPQPRQPMPLTMVVCESVPTSVSGYRSARGRSAAPPVVAAGGIASAKTTRESSSRLTWCTMPLPGGTMRKLRNARAAQRSSSKRSPFCSSSAASFATSAPRVPLCSARMLWSMTRSTGISGLISSAA